ncbi:rhamnan synthesis F family protein [Polynucleobacter sp. AP-Sving-400A-A2]|uniref:rhamnan synthesis F family protein n=1 Tax=Polynucleobacter sp. AP-Sving-400A-A2 TaxID=2081049 RepID=UPI001BFE3199|nr:rhamnan synthesis F family protein [Polynucleobacter sp. AP-Sving-400A-A2]QWE14870.1 hypothetical protein C2758_01645 [Polynucleobacter sp. AP-Sving-400A-A2]
MNFVKQIMRTLFRLIFDAFHKMGDLFNPKLHSKKMRVSNIIDGKKLHNKTSVAIFVIYQNGPIPFYVKNVLNILNSLHVNVVVTVNDDIGSEQINWLVENCHLCILRKNFGRDFGAYKDAIDILDLKSYQKLLLINDSLIYFSKNLNTLFKNFIDSPRMLVALTENFDRFWHAQTHFLGLDKNIFLSNKFKKFWSEYRPFNSRPHSIVNGEIKFSRDVLSFYAEDREVYYGVDKIIQAFSVEDAFTEDGSRVLLDLLPDMGDERSELIEFMNGRMQFTTDSDPKTIIDLEKIAINRSLAAAEKINSSHSLGLLAPFVTSTCILKRDLVFRGTFSLNQIGGAFKIMRVDYSEAQNAIREMVAKGSVSKTNLYFRLKASCGLV